jgi:hypothetical protein
MLGFLPWSFVNCGLSSNVSMCEGPPRMHRKITRLARGGKCGDFGASGSVAEDCGAPATASSASIPRSASKPSRDVVDVSHIRRED